VEAYLTITSANPPTIDQAGDISSPFNNTADQACYHSHEAYFKQLEQERVEFYDSAVQSGAEFVTQISIFETTKSYGQGKLYTMSDGIPRFRFEGPPTSIKVSSVTVTRTRLNATFVGETVKPSCEIPAALCQTLWLSYFSQKRSAEVNTTSGLEALGKICPVPQKCDLRSQNEAYFLFWPPIKASKTNYTQTNSNYDTHSQLITMMITTDVMKFDGKDIYFRGSINQLGITSQQSNITYMRPWTLSGPFTLTLPTVYLVITSLRLNDERSTASYVSPEGWPIPLRSEEIFSLRPSRRDAITGANYPMLVGQGKYSPKILLNEVIHMDIEGLNYNEMIGPIPADRYFDARYEDCWDKQTHCATITDDNYRPDLAIPGDIWSRLFPIPNDCPYIMLQDPPLALEPLRELELLPEPRVTLTSFGTKSPDPARPGQNVQLDHPLPTGLMQWPSPGNRAGPNGETQSIGEHRDEDSSSDTYGGKSSHPERDPKRERPALLAAFLNLKNPGFWSGPAYSDSRAGEQGSKNSPWNVSRDIVGVQNKTLLTGISMSLPVRNWQTLWIPLTVIFFHLNLLCI
jgi:hypothetical protein